MELCYAYGYLLRTFFFFLLIRHEDFLQEFIQHAEWVEYVAAAMAGTGI